MATQEKIPHANSDLGSIAETVNYIALQMERKFALIDQRLEKIEQRLDKIEERLNLVEQRLDLVEQRLDQLELKIETEIDGLAAMFRRQF